VKEGVNDNILMTDHPHHTVWESHISPSLRLSAAMERWQIDGNLWASIDQYIGEKGLDMNEGSLKLSSEYSTEWDRWRWAGELTRDAAWKSELLETGRVLGIQRRTVGMMSASWDRSLTERMNALGKIEYRETRYGENGTSGLFDYYLYVGTIGSTYSLSENDQLSASLDLLSYHAATVGIQSNNVGMQLSWIHPFSETIKGSVSVGIRELFTNISFGGETQREREFGWLAGGTLEKKWEHTSLRGDFSRQIDPSGAGYLIEVNRLHAVIEQSLTQTTVGSLAARFYWARPLRNDLSLSNTRAVSIEPKWSWNWTEAWSMLIGYRYVLQKSNNVIGSIDSNSVSWMLTYHGPKWSISR
jgi:hypothetical protein